MRRIRPQSLVALFITSIFFLLPPLIISGEEQQFSQEDVLTPVKEMEVAANLGWVDTEIDVKEGEQYVFKASGNISLQKGNPVANCGPEGLDLQTVQQPITDHNLGALVGRVVKVLSVRIDEETGEEIREEVSRVFFIGPEAEVDIVLEGRLYLGINDNVYADNDGKFVVSIYKKENPGQD